MPRFPFKRSVGQDLRDLFGHDRLIVQERGLGYSSISPGEGSFDILDASEVPVARYGHYAGKVGFLVPDGAGWQTVQEHTAAANAVLSGRLDDHASRIGAAENDITAAEDRLDSHASRIGAAENAIDAVEGVNATQNGRLDDHASRIGAAENDITGMSDGTKPLQSPNLVAPKMTGLTTGSPGDGWVQLLINTSTGQLRMYAGGPIG